jgi:TerC family integral membrane protein
VLLFWVFFNLFIFAMLALDLGVFNRRAHALGFREALTWSGVWIGLALTFALVVYFWHGHTSALEFVTGYVVELSLSTDNLFLFLVIFRYFKVPDEYQHRVLVWGILGSLIMRGIFILTGVGLFHRFHWITYAFGALLVYSGIKLLRQKAPEIHPEKNPVLRMFRRVMPVTDDYVDGKFFVRRPMLCATPLLVVLLFIETTDVILAVDSIPAVLAITLDAFIVYTSNVFAILGLRSMYFALAGLMELFHYLHYGISVVLILVGTKMLVSHYYKVPTEWALGMIVLVLASAIVASILHPQQTQG